MDISAHSKIRFVKHEIEELAAISPKGLLMLKIHDIFGNSFKLSIHEHFLILKKLEEEGYIKNIQDGGWGRRELEVVFELTGKSLDPFNLLSKQQITQKGPKPIKENILYDRTLKPLMEVSGLAAYSDGTIRFNGEPIHMRTQVADLCRMFMRHMKQNLNHTDLKENIIASTKQKTIAESTISKYVSELRNSLKVHFKRNVIFSEKARGWSFDPYRKT